MTKVDKAGVSGARAVTYRVVRHNGKITSRKKTSIARSPGSPSPRCSWSAPRRRRTVRRVVASGSVWDKIAQCESGGNWSINTGNGFYGGLQFTPRHLARVRRHRACRTTPAARQQIAVAKKVQAAQGWGAWPACTGKLGLR